MQYFFILFFLTIPSYVYAVCTEPGLGATADATITAYLDCSCKVKTQYSTDCGNYSRTTGYWYNSSATGGQYTGSAGCNGANPTWKEVITYTFSGSCPVPLCTDYIYTEWSECISGNQTRSVISGLPEGCEGVGSSPITARACTPPVELTNITFVNRALDGSLTQYTCGFAPDGTPDLNTCTEGIPVAFNATGNWSGLLHDEASKTWSNAALMVGPDGKVNMGLSPVDSGSAPADSTFSIEAPSSPALKTPVHVETVSEVVNGPDGSVTTITTTTTTNSDGSKTTNINTSTAYSNGVTTSKDNITSLLVPPTKVDLNLDPVVNAVNTNTSTLGSKLDDIKKAINSTLSETAPESADEIAAAANTSSDTSMNNFEQTISNDIDSIKNNYSQHKTTFPVNQTITNKVETAFPSPQTAQDVTVNIPGGHQIVIRADVFEKIRTLMSWLFGMWTLFYIYALVFEQPLIK